MSEISELMRSANPVPDPASAVSDQQFDALLLLTRTRSTDMDVKEMLVAAEPQPPNRRGWVVATVAFAVVIAAVGIAALLVPARDDTPPATSPPTTQAAPPTSVVEEPFVEPEAERTGELTEEMRTLVDTYEAAFNSGDTDRYIDMYAPGTVRTINNLDATWTLSLDEEANIHHFGLEIGSSLELTNCETRSGNTVACRSLHRDDLTRAAGIEPAWSILRLGFQNGLVTEWTETYSGYAFYDLAIDDFASWFAETHPEAEPLVVSTEPTDWLYTAENGRRAHRYLSEWQSLNSGVAPEQWGGVVAFVDVFNAADVDKYLDQYASDGVIRTFGPAGPGDVDVVRARAEYAWMTGVGTTIDDVTCAPEGEGVQCVGAMSDALHNAIRTSWPITFELEFNDEGVKRFETVSPPYWATATAFTPFRNWVAHNHPEEESAMFAASSEPRFTAESAELWTLRAAEYGQEIGNE